MNYTLPLLLGLGAAGAVIYMTNKSKEEKEAKERQLPGGVTIPRIPLPPPIQMGDLLEKSPGWPYERGNPFRAAGMSNAYTLKGVRRAAYEKVRTGSSCCVDCAYGRSCSGGR